MTPKERWTRAIDKTRRAGVHVRINVNVCCYGCTTAADIGLTDEELESVPYAMILRTQGRRVKFTQVTGEVADSTSDVAYFQWGNGAGGSIAEAFRSEGFAVEWDGTDAKRVGVVLREKVTA